MGSGTILDRIRASTPRRIIVSISVGFVVFPVSYVDIAVFVFEYAAAVALVGLVEFALVIGVVGEVLFVYVWVENCCRILGRHNFV